MFQNIEKENLLAIINNHDNFINIIPHNTFYFSQGHGHADMDEEIEFLEAFNEHSFVKVYELNSGVEILRVEDWIFVAQNDTIIHVLSVQDLMNGCVTPNQDAAVFVGHDGSALIQNDGSVFYSVFR
jgi:hypothetical protein